MQLLGSGTILREVIAAADLLEQDFGVAADVWSAPSFTELGRDGIAVERWNMLHPAEEPRQSYVEQCLAGRPDGPVVAATDYMRAFAEQIRPYVPAALHRAGHRRLRPLRLPPHPAQPLRGRPALRRAGRAHALAADGAIPASTAADAISQVRHRPRQARTRARVRTAVRQTRGRAEQT